MTDLNAKNIKSFLDLCKKVYDMSDESLEYIAHRLSDEWEPVKEYKKFIENSVNNGAVYLDQRLRFKIDFSSDDVTEIFAKEDKGFSLFKSYFANALSYLKLKNVKISYLDFLSNKVTYNKNKTKIKKVLQTVYKEKKELLLQDSNIEYTDEACEKYIIKCFEKIGSYKKSSKELELVVSFNPIDWYLSSTKENFSSCFNIDNESGGYYYSLGLPFLCGDKNRVMIYINNGYQKEHLGLKVDSVQTRTWGILNNKNTVSIVKWYPNNIIGIDPVNTITNSKLFTSREVFKSSKYPIDLLTTKKGIFLGVYSDMGTLTLKENEVYICDNEKSGFQYFTKNKIELHKTNNTRSSFNFNSRGSIGNQFSISGCDYIISKWKKYGLHLDSLFPTCYCSNCGKEDVGFIIDDSFYCKECYKDSFFVCPICGERHLLTKGNYTEVTSCENKKEYICKNCTNKLSKYICSDCGRFSKDLLTVSDFDENGNRKKVCNSCIEKNYNNCPSCNYYSKDMMYFYNTFTKQSYCYCSDCSKNISKEDYNTFARSFKIIKRNRTGGILIE